MDYPISVPSIGLVGGKFVDEDPLTGTPGSLIPAQWGNAVTDELLHVITDAGITPDELNNTQLLAAIKAVVKQQGVTPGRLLNIRTITVSGTYNPTPGTTSIVVRQAGGGGAGGGAPATAASAFSVGGGGGSGSYAVSRFTSGFSGAVITIGSGGTPLSGGNGGNGGATSFGALLTTAGGFGGSSQGNAAAGVAAAGGGGGATPSGNIESAGGGVGGYGIFVPSSANFPIGGVGSGGFWGGGGFGSTAGVGGAGTSPGAGGGGSSNQVSSAAKLGGAGAPGIVVVYEYA